MNKVVFAAGLAVSAVATLAWAPAATAQEKKDDSAHTFTGNINLASQYRYRGIEQTAGKPAVQGGFDYAHASGVYLGAWASNISWLSDLGAHGSSLEMDFYGGYKAAVGDIGVDLGGLYYYYPRSSLNGATLFNTDPNTFELYAAGTWKMLTLKYSHSLTNLFGTPDSKGSGYLDLTGNFEIGAGFVAVAHVGYQRIPGSSNPGNLRPNGSDASYTDWRLGVTKELVGVTVGLSYVDTNAKGGAGQFYRQGLLNRDLGRGTVLLTVGKTF